MINDTTISGKSKGHRYIPFSSWEEFFKTAPLEEQPWFYEGLDPNFKKTIKNIKKQVRTILDLGAGPATQALALAKRGFDVVASDISATAVELAKTRAAEKGCQIECVQDDILHTKISRCFDVIVDRGCFQVIHPSLREKYIQNVNKLLNSGGYLMLKCFSHLEPGDWGPHRFSESDIKQYFENHFQIHSIEKTLYHGKFIRLPRALFCFMQKQK